MNTQTFIAVLATAILTTTLLLFFGDKKSTVTLNQGDVPRTINVSAEAERFVTPDTASITFQVFKTAASIDEARKSVNERMGGIMTSLEGFGVKEADIKTENYSVSPEYRYEGESRNRRISGYRVNQSIRIKISDVENVEKILSTIGSNGIDGVQGPRFFVDNDEEIKQELRKEAIEEAKKKANDLGKDLGVSLKTIVGFSEGGAPRYDYALAERSFALSADSSEGFKPEIPTGESRLTANVTITFEIE